MKWSSPGSALRSAVTVTERAVVLHVAGELDYSSIAGFEALIERVRSRATDRLTLDLGRMTFCDVPGARAIYREYLRLADLGARHLRVLGTPRKLVGLSGFGLEVVEYVE